MKTRDSLKTTLVLVLLVHCFFNVQAQYKEWLAPNEANGISNPYVDDASLLKEAKKLYVQMCTMCHGDTGKGDGIAGIAIEPRPANFNSSKVQNQTDGAIFWKMTTGRAPMLAYEEILSEKQRWGLVNYIRQMSSKK
jgi:mono/diheme cytochrome c family protein